MNLFLLRSCCCFNGALEQGACLLVFVIGVCSCEEQQPQYFEDAGLTETVFTNHHFQTVVEKRLALEHLRTVALNWDQVMPNSRVLQYDIAIQGDQVDILVGYHPVIRNEVEHLEEERSSLLEAEEGLVLEESQLSFDVGGVDGIVGCLSQSHQLRVRAHGERMSQEVGMQGQLVKQVLRGLQCKEIGDGAVTVSEFEIKDHPTELESVAAT